MKTYLFTGRIARNLVVMTCLATLAAILLFAIAVSVAGEASDSIARGDPWPPETLPVVAPSDDDANEAISFPQPATSQADPSSDATLSPLTLTSEVGHVPLDPAFDPETRFYTIAVEDENAPIEAATAKDSSVMFSYTIGDGTVVSETEDDKLATGIQVLQRASTDFSLTVKAEDSQTLETYPVFFARAASQQNLPQITLEASPSEFVAGQESLFLTVAQTGDTSDELFLTINITQEQEWLTDTSHDVIISANSSSTRIRIPAVNFATEITENGNLTATVEAVDGYDTSGAMATARVISRQEPTVSVTVTVGLDKSQYFVDGGAAELKFFLVAKRVPGLPSAGDFGVSVSAPADEAVGPDDYGFYGQTVHFRDSDFSTEDGVPVARLPATVTIVDDNIFEGDESFKLELAHAPNPSTEVSLLEPDGTLCPFNCDKKYPVTIRDNDEEFVLRLTLSADRIEESGSSSVTITIESVNGNPLPVDQAITVRFNGTASYGDDYTVSPADADDTTDGHQIVPDAGDTKASLTVTAVGDPDEESCEWIDVSAVIAEDSSPTGYGADRPP